MILSPWITSEVVWYSKYIIGMEIVLLKLFIYLLILALSLFVFFENKNIIKGLLYIATLSFGQLLVLITKYAEFYIGYNHSKEKLHEMLSLNFISGEGIFIVLFFVVFILFIFLVFIEGVCPEIRNYYKNLSSKDLKYLTITIFFAIVMSFLIDISRAYDKYYDNKKVKNYNTKSNNLTHNNINHILTAIRSQLSIS